MRYLISADPRLGKLICAVGEVSLTSDENYFEFLAHTIIGQQLSLKAANTLCDRVDKLCGALTPESILRVSEAMLQNCGISRAKVSYLRNLAQHILNRDNWFRHIDTLEESEVISAVTEVKGIGPWTAEMFLIFALGRVDVFSYGDAGLQRAIRWLFGLEMNPDKDNIRSLTEVWKPYRTIASLYLWESVDKGYVNQYESIEHVPIRYNNVRT